MGKGLPISHHDLVNVSTRNDMRPDRGANLQLRNVETVPDNNFGNPWRWANAMSDLIIKSDSISPSAVVCGDQIEGRIHG